MDNPAVPLLRPSTHRPRVISHPSVAYAHLYFFSFSPLLGLFSALERDSTGICHKHGVR